MAAMDLWPFAFLALVLLLTLPLIFPSGAQQRRTATRLANIERKIELIMDHLGIDEPKPYLPEVVACLEMGKKIHAIKAYKDGTGADLREAKEAVERIARERGLDIR